jgi:hypothetical protein
LKLLLDEHFSRRVAEELRGRGHDVIAVTEDHELRGLPDAELFAHARSTGYAIVTQDYGDFVALVRAAAIDDVEHFGVMFVPKRLWSSLRDLDGLTDALERFLGDHSSADALSSGVVWLGQ